MENEEMLDHAAEAPPFPAIEVEKLLSRAQGLTSFLLNNPEKRASADQLLKDVWDAIEEARQNYHTVLTNQREERSRLIELCCASDK